MKEERLQILNMLKDGIISPDEAERLLGALADTERAQAGGSQRKNRARFDFDFADIFGTKGRSFSDFFDKEAGEEFHEKMREFKRCMRGAGQEARRKAEEAMRDAQDSLKHAFADSDLRDAFSDFGKTMAQTMEDILQKIKDAQAESEQTGDDEPRDANSQDDQST